MTRPIVELCEHSQVKSHYYYEEDGITSLRSNLPCPGGRVLEGVWIPAKEGFAEERREVGFCVEHHSLAERYADGSWGCWWEEVVEVGDHQEPTAFQPLLDALAFTQEGDE